LPNSSFPPLGPQGATAADFGESPHLTILRTVLAER
jgi:hypothetical protein